MDKSRLLEIVSANPWQTKLSLVKLCASEINGLDVDDHGAFISSLLADLLADGKLIKTGKARGTRYARADAKPFKEPKITDKDRKAVIAAVEGGASLSSEIIEIVGGDINHLRKILREVVKDGSIDKTGNARSSRYWPKGKAPEQTRSEPEGSAEPKRSPPRAEKLAKQRRKAKPPRAAEPEVEDQEVEVEAAERTEETRQPERPKVDPIVALRRAFEGLPRRSVSRRSGEEIDSNVYALDEVLRIAEDFGATRYQVSALVQDHVLGKMGEGHRLGGDLVIHSQMRYAHKRNYPGWSAYVWRPAKDDDPRPETYQPIPKSMPSEAALAKVAEAKTEKPKGKKRTAKKATRKRGK